MRWKTAGFVMTALFVSGLAIFMTVSKDQKVGQENPPVIAEEEVVKSPAQVAPTPQNSILTYTLSNANLASTFLAPSYVNKEIIAFEYDLSEKQQSFIGIMKRGEQNFKNAYTAPGKRIINSLVGVNNTLFWVEYDRVRHADWSWEIKKMDLSSKKVEVVERGKLKEELEPPVLRTDGQLITWISKFQSGQQIKSQAFIYNPVQMTKKIIAETILNEKDQVREGEFMIIQRPVSEGILVQQSHFDSKKGEKRIQIVYYPSNDSSKKTILHEGPGVIDFTSNGDWFIWTELGKLNAADLKTGEIKYIIEAKDKDLTLDSPFIRGKTLYYRYSMYQILALDLETGKITEYSPNRLTTSKLFNSDGYLGFSVMEPTKNNGRAEINIIDVKN